jgi:hypothetical protein
LLTSRREGTDPDRRNGRSLRPSESDPVKDDVNSCSIGTQTEEQDPVSARGISSFHVVHVMHEIVVEWMCLEGLFWDCIFGQVWS